MASASTPELLEELRAGRMVVIGDDEDRETEGDLPMAAGRVRRIRAGLRGDTAVGPGLNAPAGAPRGPPSPPAPAPG